MSIYNLPQSKSLKKLHQPTTKTTHILPQSLPQPHRPPTVNLSKLSTYKGKFSLTSKYNSLSSQNNHESLRQSHQVNCHNYQSQYMSESNKENVFARANVVVDEGYHEKKDKLMNNTDKMYFENEVYDEKRNTKGELMINYNKEKLVLQTQKNRNSQNLIKTQPTSEESQEQTQNMKKIIMAASSFNFKNPQQQHNKTTPVVNKNPIKTDKPLPNNKQSISNKQKANSKDKNSKQTNNQLKVAQRRIKFHKYDNSVEENEFLVVEQQVPISSLPLQQEKNKKPSIQKKPVTRQANYPKNQPKSPYLPHIHTQTLKLHQLPLPKHQQLQTQLQSYKQSIKHITYSMIKMISLIGKLQMSQGSQSTINQRNLKIINQIQSQIFTLYNKELGKYVDKLNIREQIVEMARQEEEFIKRSKITTNNGIKINKQQEIQIIKSQESSRYDYSISHQQHSYFQQSPDSLLHQYQIRQSSCSNDNSLNDDSLNHQHHQDQNSSKQQNFFDFDSIKHLQIMPSGRNLLQTFNNQHLCNELQVIGNELINELEQSREEYQDSHINSIEIARNHNQNNFNKKPIVVVQKKQQPNYINQIGPQTIQQYQQNLSYGLKQISITQTQLPQPQPHHTQICRKLFSQQQSSHKPTHTLSPINHLHSTTSVLSNHNQNSQPSLLPDHYYQVISSSSHTLNQNSNNYLKLTKGDTIKLLRKVDNSRWIAELEDKIGFVEEQIVVQRVRLVGKTAKKYIQSVEEYL